VDAALEQYYLLQLAMFGNKNQNAHDTVKEWRKSGLDLPEEGSPISLSDTKSAPQSLNI